MNEELLVSAIFEQAVFDYEKAKRVLNDPYRRREDADIACKHLQDVRSFSIGKEIIMYAGGSERVIQAFKDKLDEIDRRFNHANRK